MPKLDITNANNVVEFHPQKAFFQVKNLGGPKGDKGDRGEPGAGLKITDTVATYDNLPTTLEYCDSGAAYFVRSDGQLYIWNGYEFPAEGHGAQFEGPQGPQGEPGRNGTDGRDGTDGADGFSPEATVEQVGAGARITITDKNGTTTADVAGFTVDDALSDSSTNPVQNKVVKGALDGKQATLGAGDITTSLIADNAITQAKMDWGGMLYPGQLLVTARNTTTLNYHGAHSIWFGGTWSQYGRMAKSDQYGYIIKVENTTNKTMQVQLEIICPTVNVAAGGYAGTGIAECSATGTISNYLTQTILSCNNGSTNIWAAVANKKVVTIAAGETKYYAPWVYGAGSNTIYWLGGDTTTSNPGTSFGGDSCTLSATLLALV